MDTSSTTNTVIDPGGMRSTSTRSDSLGRVSGRKVAEIEEVLADAERDDLANHLRTTYELLHYRTAAKGILEAQECARRESRLGRALLRLVDYLAMRRLRA